jgi:putative membrane protein
MMGTYGYGGFGWIGMILNLIITVGVIVGVILLVVWLVRRFSGNSTSSILQTGSGQSAKEIAQARYARGEISRDEYQNILADLGH